MKKILLFIIITFFSFNFSFAQIFIDEFDYPASESLTSHGYISYAGGDFNSIKIIEGSLSYPEYSSSGVGNMIQLKKRGQFVYSTLDTEISSGTIYASMLVSVDSAQSNGDYFFHFSPSPIDTNYRARTLIKLSNNGKIAFGINKASTYASIKFTDSVYEIGETYLLVVGYKFVDGEDNDSVKLWVNPEISEAQPPADLIVADSNKNNEDIEVGTFGFRQGYDSLAAILKLDGLRIDTTWFSTLVPVAEEYLSSLSFNLEQNFPNPFNPSTRIKFSVPSLENVNEIPVTLKVFDIIGNEIATLVNEVKSPGVYEVPFDAGDLASGIYFYRLRINNFSEVKKCCCSGS